MKKLHKLIIISIISVFIPTYALAAVSIDPLSVIAVYAATYVTNGADSTITGNVFTGTATIAANSLVTGNLTTIGAATIGAASAISGNVVTGAAATLGAGSSISGDLSAAGAATIGANAFVAGNVISGAAASIGAGSVIGGNIITGAATTIGANSILSGDITSGAAATIGASSSVAGNVAAYGAITVGAGSTVGSQTSLAANAAPTPNTTLASHLSDFSIDLARSVINLQSKLTAYGEGTALPATFDSPLVAGVYSADSLTIAGGTSLVLDARGLDNQSFVFNINTFLALGASTKITLINAGANDKVFWNVGGYVSIGASSIFTGTIVAEDAISIGANSKLIDPNFDVGSLYSVRSFIVADADTDITSTSKLESLSGSPAVITAVPEPATWAMMIAGFGLAGASLRIRRRRDQRPLVPR